MKHYLNVCDIKGNEVTPVDIITFGSPCQDLSVAGKRAGLKHEANGDEETTRSGLFMEAVRIIKEMRKATNGRYPTFALWENVPGAFSSNRGQDFRTVLEELAKVVDETVSVPMPPKGRWTTAGGLEGDGWSISWRTLDAQYHGVPQRRRRILLVADFRGQRAGEISFKCEGLPGYPSKSREERKETSTDLKRSSGVGYRTEGFDGYNLNMTGNVAKTITSARTDTHSIPGVVQTVYSIQGGGETSQSSRGDGWNENVCYTLNTLDKHAVAYEDPKAYTMKIRSGCEGGGKGPLVQTEKSATLATNNDQYLFQPIAIGHDERSCRYSLDGKTDPLTANDYKQPISVVYDARGNGNGQIVPTMTGNHDCRITDYTSCVVQTEEQVPFTKSSFSNYSEGVGTLKSSGGDLGGGAKH